jgi:hypothetical protein
MRSCASSLRLVICKIRVNSTLRLGACVGISNPAVFLLIDGWVRPDAWHPGTNVAVQPSAREDVAVARVVRTRRKGNKTYLQVRYLPATADGYEDIEEMHVLTLFSDVEYRAAFESAGLSVEVVPGPLGQERDRYVAVAE